MVRARGFALVELAVGLLVIALLLAAVLGVEALLLQSRVREVARDTTALAGAMQLYRARYGALPGDDPGTAARWGGVAGGNGDGVLGGRYDRIAPADAGALAGGVNDDESVLAWWHLRRAGFLTGVTDGAAAAAAPVAPGGLRMGLQTAAFGIVGTVACLGDAGGDVAEAIDRNIDDGSPHTGVVRAGASLARPAETYAHAARYVVCICLDGRHGPSVLASAAAAAAAPAETASPAPASAAASDASGAASEVSAAGADEGKGNGNGHAFAGTGNAGNGNGGNGSNGKGNAGRGNGKGRNDD